MIQSEGRRIEPDNIAIHNVIESCKQSVTIIAESVEDGNVELLLCNLLLFGGELHVMRFFDSFKIQAIGVKVNPFWISVTNQ